MSTESDNTQEKDDGAGLQYGETSLTVEGWSQSQAGGSREGR